MDGIYAKAMFERKEKRLVKPFLKRSSPIAIPKTPNELDVSVKEVAGGRLQGNFIFDAPETAVAYDIAGNAVECSREDILKKKLRPAPIEKEMIWTDDHLKKTRSGVTYGA